jgi:hypothetical protein
MRVKEFSKKIPTPKKNYRLPFEKYKLPITHKWVDGIKIICSLRFVMFLEPFRFLYNFFHLGHQF